MVSLAWVWRACDKVVVCTCTSSLIYMKFLAVQIFCTCRFDFHLMLSY
jgi:hypothetical protein